MSKKPFDNRADIREEMPKQTSGNPDAFEPLIRDFYMGKIHQEVVLEKLMVAAYSVNQEKAIGLGDNTIDFLFQALKDTRFRENAASILANIPDRRIVEKLIEFFFSSQTRHVYDLHNRHANYDGTYVYDTIATDWITKFRNLFGDYADYIINCANIKIAIKTIAGEDQYHYNLIESQKAIDELCKINSEVSSNILHIIKSRNDMEVPDKEHDSWQTSVEYKMLSFENQRLVARKELERRGNPPYDPSVYLNKELWTIKK